jgi:hypothetical protein
MNISTRRAVVVVVEVLVFVALVVLARPSSAAAASPPPPSSPPSSVPDQPGDRDLVPLPVPAPVPTLPAAPVEDERPPAGESLIPDAAADDVPTGNFDIGYDEGAWNHFGRKTLGFFTGLGWTLNRIVVGATLWLVGWTFGFDITGPLQGPILTIAGVWNTQLAGPLQLAHLIWFAVMAYVALSFFRGRAMAGLGEFVMSVAALAVASTIGANPAGYLNGATTTLRETSGAVLSISRGQPPSDDGSQVAQIVDPLRAELHDVLIEEPHQIINWGAPLSGDCARVARELVAESAWGTSDTPRERMRDAGCGAAAAFNEKPSFERMASAWMAALVSIIVLGLLVLAVITMLVASLLFILRFSWLYLALLGFQAPGMAREFAWGWLVGLFKNLATVAGMSFVISYLMLCASAFLNAPGVPIAGRFAVLIVLSVAMYLYRRQVLQGIAHLSDRLRGELGSLRIGGSRTAGGWTRAQGGPVGMTGFGIGQRAREVALDVPGSTAYEVAYLGRRFRYGSRGRSGSQRNYQQRFVGGSEFDVA